MINNKLHILGIIPARGGSKGIPQKNIYPLGGKPLIAWTIEAANKSKLLSRTILSTDSDEIISKAKKWDIQIPFKRSAELARDDTPALPVIKHAVTWVKENENYIPDYIVLLQPTSPLRTSLHIDEALQKLINSDADSIVSVVDVPHNFNPYSVMKLSNGYLVAFMPYDENMNLRQQKPKFYARNGAAIYAFTYECLMKKNSLYGDKTLPYFMSKEESFDIDDILDMQICEMIINTKCSKLKDKKL